MMFTRHRSKGAARPQQDQQQQSQSLSPRRRPFLRIARSKTAGSDSEDETQQQPLREARVLPAAATAAVVEQPQPYRSRLDTEDTLRMSNLILPDLMVENNNNRQDRLNKNEDNVIDEDNPFLECRTSSSVDPLDDSEQQQRPLLSSVEPVAKNVVVDCATTVSSLGQGSFKMPQAVVAAAPLHQQPVPVQQQPRPPQPPVVPKVIYFRVASEVPDWLLVEDDETANSSDQANEADDGNIDRKTEQQESLCQQNSHDPDDAACLADGDDDTAENHRPTTTAAVVSPLRPFRPRLSFGARQQKGPPSLPFPAPPLSETKQKQPAVTSNKKKKKKELQLQQQEQQEEVITTTLTPALSPVWTDVPSPANNLRPTMGRFKSMSSSSLFPNRTPKNLKHRHSSHNHQGGSTQAVDASPSTPDTAIAVAAIAITPDTAAILAQQQKKNKKNQGLTLQETQAEAVVLPAAWAKVPPTPISPKLPPSSAAATRKGHHHKRILSCEGSLLGHTSLWTASTVASSSQQSNPQQQQLEAPLSSSSLAHARRTSTVVQELRSAWTKVVGPPPSPGAGVDAKVVSEWEWMQQQHHSAHGCWT